MKLTVMDIAHDIVTDLKCNAQVEAQASETKANTIALEVNATDASTTAERIEAVWDIATASIYNAVVRGDKVVFYIACCVPNHNTELIQALNLDLSNYGIDSEVSADLRPTILVTVPESQSLRAQEVIAQTHAGEVTAYNAIHKDGKVTLFYAY